MGPLLLINQSQSSAAAAASARRRNSTGSNSTASSSSGGCRGIGDNVTSGNVVNVNNEDDNKRRRSDNDSTVIVKGVTTNNANVTKGVEILRTRNGEEESFSNSSSTEESQPHLNHQQQQQQHPGQKKRGTNQNYNNACGNKSLMNPGQFLLMNNQQNHVRSHVSSSTMQMDKKSHLNLQIATGSTTFNNATNCNNSTKGIGICNNNNDEENNAKKSTGLNANAQITANSLRKYLVLLQDCLAIKFVPAYQSQYTNFNDDLSSNYRGGGGGGILNNAEPEVDHSIHGLCLYKGFREANLKCYWNATLCEAIGNLDYKGYIVPSTILVFALPRFLAVLRTAWSRKMLRNPTGYCVEFVGEIEEMIAEPMAQGQFAPLSDSLCWAILELTSSGQEAFVDSIIFALSSAFPSMSLPPRELVYSTLEKLIRERKIYQTSHGYFVVTPDTFRYMNSGGEQSNHYSSLSTSTLPLDALVSSYYESDKISQHSGEWGSGGGSANGEDLVFCHSTSNATGLGPLKRHNSLRVIRQKDLDLLMPTMGARSLSFRLAKSKPVFESDREDKQLINSNKSSTLGSTSASDQMTPGSIKGTSSSEGGTLSQDEKAKGKSRKKASFFRRLFSFRRHSRSKSKQLPPVPVPLKNSPGNEAQTSPGSGEVRLESLTRSPKIYSSLPRIRPQYQFTDSNDPTASAAAFEISEEEFFCIAQTRGQSKGDSSNKWNSLPSSANRRLKSRRSIINESPFYDTLTFDTISSNQTKPKPRQVRPMSEYIPSTSSNVGTNGMYNGNASTYQSGSLGRNTQRLRHLSGTNLCQRSDSPCPSAIYASINATSSTIKGHISTPTPTPAIAPTPTNPPLFRRRYNSSQGQSNRYSSRPKSAFEILAFQNQYQQNRRKSVESLVNQQKIGSNSKAFSKSNGLINMRSNNNKEDANISNNRKSTQITKQVIGKDENISLKLKQSINNFKDVDTKKSIVLNGNANIANVCKVGTSKTICSSGKDSDVSH